MKVTASLNNLRMSPRKVRLVANFVKGLPAKQAKSQLQFASKKAAGIILKLLNSGLNNAKNSFSLDENNLYIAKLTVEAGPSLKRWLPRAMGRATPILKRTSNINLVLEERVASQLPPKAKKTKVGRKEKEEIKPFIEKEEKIFAVPESSETKDFKARPIAPPKPYGATSQSKKRFFSRQTLRKIFQRKSL